MDVAKIKSCTPYKFYLDLLKDFHNCFYSADLLYLGKEEEREKET